MGSAAGTPSAAAERGQGSRPAWALPAGPQSAAPSGTCDTSHLFPLTGLGCLPRGLLTHDAPSAPVPPPDRAARSSAGLCGTGPPPCPPGHNHRLSERPSPPTDPRRRKEKGKKCTCRENSGFTVSPRLPYELEQHCPRAHRAARGPWRPPVGHQSWAPDPAQHLSSPA